MRPSPVPSPPPGFIKSLASKLAELADHAHEAASSAVHESNTPGMVDQRARRHQTALGHLVKYVEHASNRALVLDDAMRSEGVGKDRPLALLASEGSGHPILTTLYWAGGAEPVYNPGPWQTRFLGGLGMTTAFFDPADVLLHLAALSIKDRDAEMRASEAELAREREGADRHRTDLESVSKRLAAATEELRDRDAETLRLRAVVDRLETETARATERASFWRARMTAIPQPWSQMPLRP